MFATVSLLFLSTVFLGYNLMPHASRAALRKLLRKISIYLSNAYKVIIQACSVTRRKPMATDLQESCPLFTCIPGEIRDRIFQYAVTEHAVEKKEYEKNAHFYRPGFRFADQKLDTALLRTCRRIYEETKHLPSDNFVQVEWCNRPPPSKGPRHGKSVFSYHHHDFKHVKSFHLFTQQYWLEPWEHNAQKIAESAPNLRYIKITQRHGDWWQWEDSAPLKLDPKQGGTANLLKLTQASDPFSKDSWGNQFQRFHNLKLFELELESIEGKRTELDEIVRRAPGWRFPLSETHVLALNPKLTMRTGRIGLKLPGGVHVPNDPVKAKERLVKDGVDFTIPDGEAEITGSAEECLTYYVVTLFFESRSKKSLY